MLGVSSIASYIPHRKASNNSAVERFNVTEEFIIDKIGVRRRAVKEHNENTSDLCINAYRNLIKKVDINPDDIDVIILVTQNPDYRSPHTASIIHGRLGFRENIATFDISLGCSGYIYGLANIISFMQFNNMKKGLLFTADPYSKIVSYYDKNTYMIFGDAATVTLIDSDPIFTPVRFSFGTVGRSYRDIICEDNELYMNGRAVSNFVLKTVIEDIRLFFDKVEFDIDDIDLFLLHQGSKFIVTRLMNRLNLDAKKVPFDIEDYGNTISSSIPIMLEKYLNSADIKTLFASGFGVGLSWGNTLLKRA